MKSTRFTKGIVSFALAFACAALTSAEAGSAFLMDARPSPAWFTRGVVYQVQPRAFTPEGTLKAIEARLPYLKDLGVTIVYLVPVGDARRDAALRPRGGEKRPARLPSRALRLRRLRGRDAGGGEMSVASFALLASLTADSLLTHDGRRLVSRPDGTNAV